MNLFLKYIRYSGGENVDIDLNKITVPGEVTQGEVVNVEEPQKVETRFGTSYRIPFRIKIGTGEITVSILVRENSLKKGILHPRSNLYKLLTKYGAKNPKDMIGKKVDLRIDSRGFYRFIL